MDVQLEKVKCVNRGFLAEFLVAEWLRFQKYSVECSIPQSRGTEKARSMGDIDLVATKDGERMYVEVKYWGSGVNKYKLSPSTLAEHVLERTKTFREEGANKYLLIYHNRGNDTFTYDPKRKYCRHFDTHGVPKELLQSLSGQNNHRCALGILEHIVRKHSPNACVDIRYFPEIVEDLRRSGKLAPLKDEFARIVQNEVGQLFGVLETPIAC